MRLDAVARYLQDIAMDDVVDGGLHEPAWVVRRTLIRVARWPRYREDVDVATFCWSMGTRSAERRTTIAGRAGGEIDTLTLWVKLDPTSGRPERLSDAFRELYRDAVAGRLTDHGLRHDGPPPSALRRSWPLRVCDFDLHGHVNNSVYWTAVEERLQAAAAADRLPASYEMEFRAAIPFGVAVDVVEPADDACGRLWLAEADRTIASAAFAASHACIGIPPPSR